MDQQTDKTAFLCETYRFRNWTTLAVALFFGSGGAYAVCWGFGALYFGGVRQQRLDAVVCGLFAIGVGSALLFVTYRALTSWLADHKITTCIDEHGIQVGDMLYPYDLVCWIGGRRPFPFSPKVELAFGCDNYRQVCHDNSTEQAHLHARVSPTHARAFDNRWTRTSRDVDRRHPQWNESHVAGLSDVKRSTITLRLIFGGGTFRPRQQASARVPLAASAIFIQRSWIRPFRGPTESSNTRHCTPNASRRLFTHRIPLEPAVNSSNPPSPLA